VGYLSPSPRLPLSHRRRPSVKPSPHRCELRLTTTAHIEEPEPVEGLTPELQLPIAFKVLHCLEMAEKSRSLSTEELEHVEFLVAQVASLSSSLACEAATAESPTPPSVAREVINLQSDPIVPSATPLRSGILQLLSSGH
jgi:hypothetical protein